jgi:hypothetical protein
MSKEKNQLALRPDSNVREILKALDAKIKSLKHIEETPWKTNGVLDGFGDIKNEKLVPNLIRALSSVRGREKGYLETAEDSIENGGMGLSNYPAFEIGGFTTKDWQSDILLRKEIIEHKETLDKLTEFKTRATEFMTEQDKKSLLFADMAQYLQVKG